MSQSTLLIFRYQGTNAQGKVIKGRIEAPTKVSARAQLRRQGIQPKRIHRALFESKPKKQLKAEELAAFSRQLTTLLESGVPLMQSFDIIIQGSESDALTEVVKTLKSHVESGTTFASACAAQPKVFDSLYCHLIEAGENAGALEQLLDRIALYLEKQASLRRKIKKALAYPVVIILAAIVVTGILLIYVVPQFETLFANFGAELPAFTQFVIALSEWTQRFGWLVALLLVSTGLGTRTLLKRSLLFRQRFDAWLLKLPIIGSILNKAAIARFARTLATTFAAGVPLIESLGSVSGATGNWVFANAVMKMKEEIATGTTMQQSLRNTGVFPNMVVQMIGIGEEAGSLDKMLNKVASIYEEEVDVLVDTLSSLLEPLIMAVLGVLVGGLVVAMYLPIFKMGAVI